MVGTNDVGRATTFYDELLGMLGAKRWMESDRGVAYSAGEDRPGIGVGKPFDGNAASVGNGTMVALTADSTDQVDEIYAKAIALGGTDEGEPGFRMGGPFYAGYFRDLDGNKLCVFHVAPQE